MSKLDRDTAWEEIRNTETAVLVRNVQLANARIERVIKELDTVTSEQERKEIIADNKHVGSWIGMAQGELGSRFVSMSLWDCEPMSVEEINEIIS